MALDDHAGNVVALGSSQMDETLALMGDAQASRRLNLLGYLCPVPVFETRRALEEMAAGTILDILCDDPDVKHDIPVLVARLGSVIISTEERDGEWRFRIRSGGVHDEQG